MERMKRSIPVPELNSVEAKVAVLAFRATIRRIPKGKVATYGDVAAKAGYPGAARQVASVLKTTPGLPWQRVVGAGGQIRLRGELAHEQRLRLEAEGVKFRGLRVDMKRHSMFKAESPGK